MGEQTFWEMLLIFPMAMAGAGLLLVAYSFLWFRLPVELEPEVLAALSETEALPSWEVRQRPPLAERDIDVGTLIHVLEGLCRKGLVVRWYEEVEMPGPKGAARRELSPVYRRVARPAAEGEP